jgi:transcriptional regulator with XRE-family HTH domain
MNKRISERVKAQREQRGWTQDHLAEVSGLGLRTIQRIESDEERSPSQESMLALAAAFGCDVSTLLRGLSSSELTALQEDFLCPTCGARMIEQTAVPHEFGDAELEVFQCGFSRGWRWRPCPRDLCFPKLDEYELSLRQDKDGTWSCYALGRTPAARAVSLQIGRGRSEEEARSMVFQSYRSAEGAAA